MGLAMPLHHTVRRGWTTASTWGRAARRHRHAASNTSSTPADCCPDSPLELHLLAKSRPSQDGSFCSPSVWKEDGEGEYRTWSPGIGEEGSVGQAFRGARRAAVKAAHNGPGSQQCPDSPGARWTPKTVPDQVPTSTSRGQGVFTSSSQKKLNPRA